MRNRNGSNGTGVLEDATLDSEYIVEEAQPEAAASGKDEKKGKNKKLGLAVIGLILLVGVVAAVLFVGSRNKVVTVSPPAQSQQPSPNTSDTAKAIDSLGQKMEGGVAVTQGQPNVAVPPTGLTTAPQTPVTSTTPDVGNVPVTSTYPGMETMPNGVAGTVQGTQPTTTSTQVPQQQTSSRTPTQPRAKTPLSQIESAPAKQTSTYFFSDSAIRTLTGGNQVPGSTTMPVTVPLKAAPVVPPFGATLPVRSLGAIYSLRREGYVRLETTRMVKGDGWSLPRGTQLVGRISGTQNNRIFIALLGYISDGKLVRVGGEIRGVDGGDGLQGSRKRVGNRFLKAVREVGGSALQTFNSWLAGRNGSTQIYLPNNTIRDAQEGYNLQNITEYVAVRAGTLGSVMITDLPKEVEGVQPDTSDGGDGESQGMLSDDEVIELIMNGSPEQIRAALPRMPEQVRPLAEASIKGR